MSAKNPKRDTLTVIVCAARCDSDRQLHERTSKIMTKVGPLYFCPACLPRARDQYDLWDKENPR